MTVDHYSRYFELDKLSSTTSTAVITKLKVAFARHGVPEDVISDNGPQYSSGEFGTFARAWEFTHTTTSPYHPQSNGLAEKSVQNAKMLLEKAKADKRNTYLSLLEYRNSPVDGFKSPAQLLMSCRCKNVGAKRLHKQQLQKCYYDRSAKHLCQLKEGQVVRMQEQEYWKPAAIISTANTERSYHVSTDGQEYRRNRHHLLDTKEPRRSCSDDATEPCEEPTHSASHNDFTHTPNHTDNLSTSGTYITRYGREIKLRVVLNL